MAMVRQNHSPKKLGRAPCRTTPCGRKRLGPLALKLCFAAAMTLRLSEVIYLGRSQRSVRSDHAPHPETNATDRRRPVDRGVVKAPNGTSAANFLPPETSTTDRSHLIDRGVIKAPYVTSADNFSSFHPEKVNNRSREEHGEGANPETSATDRSHLVDRGVIKVPSGTSAANFSSSHPEKVNNQSKEEHGEGVNPETSTAGRSHLIDRGVIKAPSRISTANFSLRAFTLSFYPEKATNRSKEEHWEGAKCADKKATKSGKRHPRHVIVPVDRGCNQRLKIPHNNTRYSRRHAFKKNSMPKFVQGTFKKRAGEDVNDDRGNEEEQKEGEEKCVLMHGWQSSSFPNCNSFHELDLLNMKVIDMGAFRIALEMSEYIGGNETKFVFKAVQFKEKINGVTLELQRGDGLVLERTTSSRFIPNSYGFCGAAVLMDFVPDGNLHDYMEGWRRADGASALALVDKLRIAIHIANGVADLHSIDGTDVPSYFHNDLSLHQYLYQDGIFKLNDFHSSKAIKIKKSTGEACSRHGYAMGFRKKRSLDELLHFIRPKTFKLTLKPDKVDIWIMGDLIYTILTDWPVFEKPRNLNLTETATELLAGRRSPLPRHIEESRDDAPVAAMLNALDMCWAQDWSERASAQDVAAYLTLRLREITGEESPDLRVAPPRKGLSGMPGPEGGAPSKKELSGDEVLNLTVGKMTK